MARVPDVRGARGELGKAPDGEYRAATGQLPQEGTRRLDLGARRPPVRVVPRGKMRVRRHRVPAEHLLFERKLGQRAADDRGARLRRACPGELPLGGEGDAGDACAAVAGRLADEQQRRVCARGEIVVEALGEPLIAVLVERVAEPRPREPLYQRSQWTTSSSARRRWVKRLDARLAFGSGRALPSVTPATTCTSSGIPSRSLNACRSGTVTP